MDLMANVTEQTSRPELPTAVVTALRTSAGLLRDALRPHMTAYAETSPDVRLVWMMAKALGAMAGDLAPSDRDDEGFAMWEEVAGIAADVALAAYAIAATGLTLDQAAARVTHVDGLEYEAVMGEPTAFSGTVEVYPLDHDESSRVLTVVIGGGPTRELSVGATVGEAPEPQPHTPATLLQTAALVRQLGHVAGRLVQEPPADGYPIRVYPHQAIDCAVCQQQLLEGTARQVDVGRGEHTVLVRVCSKTCSRAAYAGEHDSD
jgi:hypothetical protein